ncbi:P-loop containing nucleoside triphosphate hydrolase protein [Dioszegia hungarica]|uniref:P-loop containing nucleoside triphosphate hydrolase protein n=1 Tax=Dioszegia hungarica TaxID=4972 RepID=A0AA38HI37_9TREE|nr:P-loop containing nucleoside triphosphate hydrolase protein [Dioszegia hungarica]KAI9639834.1 P-loop containing nucleoside triphosphate hydrolase protein [Dioszegia hungarica]
MDSNAIQIVVRVRPFHAEREQPFLSRPITQHYFLGDGNFASSPRRPISAGSIRQVIDVCDDRMLDFDKPEVGAETRRGQPGAKRYKNRQYIFDSVLKMEATQEEVFEKTALPLIDGVLTGFNATVFAYGATGCGKTHTISGTPEEPGIIIRTTAELFRRIEESKDDYETHIEVSMVEIYNETIRDLLAPEGTVPPVGGLKLLENEKERVRVDKVTLLRPQSVEEVMDYVQLGNARRSTSSTAMNAVSSRSHAVLQINIGRNSKGCEIDMAESSVRQCMSSATLSIIDLAGSERAAATSNMGARMREGANINKSLLSLSSCIAALCERPTAGQRPHIPYRNSKLTRMLKFSLGGNCRTVMVVCISPSSRDLEDTNNTLVWANKAKNVSTKVSRNTQGVDVRVQAYLEAIQRLNTEVAALKKEIAEMRNGEKVWNDNRRMKDREDCQKAVVDVADMVAGSMGVLADGASKRAGWDGAEMIVAALKGRLQEAEEQKAGAEITLFNSLIRQQDMRYKSNASAINAIDKEASQKLTIDGVLGNLEQRKFGPSVDPSDLDNVKTHVQLKRAEVDRAIMEAREKVYRQTIQAQAGAIATAASTLHRLSTGLASQLAELAARGAQFGDITGELERMGESSRSALSSFFLSAASGALPSIPAAPSLGRPAATSISPPTATARATLGRPARSRPSVLSRPGEASFSLKSAVLASPAGKRLFAAQNLKLPASPLRKPHHVTTPGKRKLRHSLAPVKPIAKARPVIKGLRWKDEAGEGDLEQMKVMTSDDSSSGNLLSSGEDGDASGEWEECGDTVKPLPVLSLPKPKRIIPRAAPPVSAMKQTIALPKSSPPSQPSSSIPVRRLPSPLGPSPFAPSMPPPPVPSLPSSSAGQNEYWKGARTYRPAAILSGLRTLDEEGSSGSSPDSEPSKQPAPLGLGLGPPTRIRLPLNDRSDVPGGNTSTSYAGSYPPQSLASGSGSGLYRPTMSSIGKAAGKTASPVSVSGTTGPRPSISSGFPTLNRRASSIGPLRTARSKARLSTAPGMASSHPADNSSLAPFAGDVSTQSALSGGAHRLFAPTASSLSRRASTLNLGSMPVVTGVGETGSLRGPRPSMSMAQLRPMGARPSVQGLFRPSLGMRAGVGAETMGPPR